MPRNFGFRISDFHPSTRRDTEACTLEERRPRHSRPSFHHWEESAYRPSWGEVRRNRRAAGASAGWKSGCDERSRSELTCFQPAVGDRQIAGCSAVNRWHRRITSATTSLRLCDFASLRFVSWVALRLCGSAPLRLCVEILIPQRRQIRSTTRIATQVTARKCQYMATRSTPSWSVAV